MIRKLSAILLATLILVLNMSLTFSTHYCGGEAVETSVSLGKADVGCGMEETVDNDCETPLDEPSLTNHCCENVHYTLDLDEDYKENNAHQVAIYKSLVGTFNTNVVQPIIFTGIPDKNKTYDPPLVERDISVMHQVFRL